MTFSPLIIFPYRLNKWQKNRLLVSSFDFQVLFAWIQATILSIDSAMSLHGEQPSMRYLKLFFSTKYDIFNTSAYHNKHSIHVWKRSTVKVYFSQAKRWHFPNKFTKTIYFRLGRIQGIFMCQQKCGTNDDICIWKVEKKKSADKGENTGFWQYFQLTGSLDSYVSSPYSLSILNPFPNDKF